MLGKSAHTSIVILSNKCSHTDNDHLNRKGSISFKNSSSRRESMTRRAAMRLGGLRVITSGGISAGLDASLYLVSILVDDEAAKQVAHVIQHEWVKGTVVDGLDV